MASLIPILDSHIHLYPASELETLAWCSPDHPLTGQHSLDEYALATSSPGNLEGFIFLETDRKHDLASGIRDGSGWKFPLMEVEWLKRIATGTPKPGEGHLAEEAHLCKAIIPWAPLPSGADAVEKYVELVKEAAGESFGKIKGFRYLVQGKPKGTMTGKGFVEGLRWLGRKGYVFDHGMDMHRDGAGAMEETFEMINAAHEGVEKKDRVSFILNHLCKPDLTLTGDVQSNPSFIAWREGIYNVSRCDKTYIKLSGCFSEIPEDNKLEPQQLFEALQPWLAVVLAAFGPFRIMFGSDWPVCTVGGVKGDAWKKWVWIVGRMCDFGGLSTEEQVMLWSGTAIKAYGIEELI